MFGYKYYKITNILGNLGLDKNEDTFNFLVQTPINELCGKLIELGFEYMPDKLFFDFIQYATVFCHTKCGDCDDFANLFFRILKAKMKTNPKIKIACLVALNYGFMRGHAICCYKYGINEWRYFTTNVIYGRNGEQIQVARHVYGFSSLKEIIGRFKDTRKHIILEKYNNA